MITTNNNDNGYKFSKACEEGSLEIVRKYKNLSFYDVICGFDYACMYNKNTEVIEYLFEEFLLNDKYKYLNRILYYKLEGFQHSSRNGNLNVVKYFFQKFPEFSNFYIEEAFYLACTNQKFNVIKYLVSKKVNIITSKNFSKIFKLLTNDYGRIERLDIFKYLIKNCKEFLIHFKNEIFFRTACSHGDLELVKILIEDHGNVDILAEKDQGFFDACENGYFEIVEYLIKIDLENIDDNFIRLQNKFGRKNLLHENFETIDKRFLRVSTMHDIKIVKYLHYLLKNKYPDVYIDYQYIFYRMCTTFCSKNLRNILYFIENCDVDINKKNCNLFIKLNDENLGDFYYNSKNFFENIELFKIFIEKNNDLVHLKKYIDVLKTSKLKKYNFKYSFKCFIKDVNNIHVANLIKIIDIKIRKRKFDIPNILSKNKNLNHNIINHIMGFLID